MTFDTIAARLVRQRRQGLTLDESEANYTLEECFENQRQKSTDDHAVDWNVSSWLNNRNNWYPDVRASLETLANRLEPSRSKNGWKRISRNDVFSTENPLERFLASMAWGFGDTGYGAYRTRHIIGYAKGSTKVVKAARTLENADSPANAFRAWSKGGDAKLYGLNTSFASKVAYFSAYNREHGKGPLIADLNTARAMQALSGNWDSRASADVYSQYVDWAEARANDLGCRSDDVERALFQLGMSVRSASKSKQVNTSQTADASICM